MLTVSFLSFIMRSVACLAYAETSGAMVASGVCRDAGVLADNDMTCEPAAAATLDRMYAACDASIPRDWDLPMNPWWDYSGNR